MKIFCKTEKEFYDTIYEMVVRGLTFNAVVSDLSIELLGGY